MGWALQEGHKMACFKIKKGYKKITPFTKEKFH